MKRRFTPLIGAVGVATAAAALIIGAGALQAQADSSETSSAETLSSSQKSTPAPTDASSTAAPVEEALLPAMPPLPAEMIAGLPGYTDSHDHETYARVQTWVKICMTQNGYSYGFDLALESSDVTGLASNAFVPMPAEYDQDEQVKLYGEAGNLLPDYDWNSGGCYGEAVHKAGLLDDDSTGFTEAELAEITALYNSMAYPPEQAWGYAGDTPGFASGFDSATGDAIDASITSCMNEHGFDFEISDNVRPDGAVQFRDGAFGMNPISGDPSDSSADDALVVLYGPHLSADQPYDWQTGGCYGAAIHEAGIPGAE